MPPAAHSSVSGELAGDQVGHLGDEGERRAPVPVTAGLRALRDDDVGARLERELRIAGRLDLAEQRHARRADRRGERARVAEREHERARPVREHAVEDARALASDQVMKPQPTSASPASANCASIQSASP